ncbi:hypothetical protein MSAN_00410600 [Mycena sanguinolenta]|uniref:Uncharacterized protein n=1 Tax=Mycena sanguinolenta TaxID=230812 RepID=A0A8H6ZA05_9AGAR|nr:hypothetical protein MSAN_00410600 [Mycena sanguinolenta]
MLTLIAAQYPEIFNLSSWPKPHTFNAQPRRCLGIVDSSNSRYLATVSLDKPAFTDGIRQYYLLPHFMTHRTHPMNPAPPIFAVGPPEFDFEFVKYGLSNWPWRSWLLYGCLVASVVLHAVDGERLVFNTYFGETIERIKAAARKNLLAIGLGLVAVPVLTGALVMSREPLMVLPSATERFHASFTHSPLFKI